MERARLWVSNGAMQSVSSAVTETPPPPTGLLVELAADLASGGELHALVERFLQPVIGLAGAQAGAVRLLSDAGDRLELVGSLGLPEGVVARVGAAHPKCGHCGHAADEGTIVWASDLQACSERSGSSYFGGGCQRMMVVPLHYRERLLGVYNLFFATEPEPSAEVQQILRSVGELLGLALNNARLERDHLRATLARERQALAAEVHDALGQSLAFVRMRLPLLVDALRAGDDDKAERYHEDIRSAAAHAHTSLRSIVTQMRAPMDPRGLLHALGAAADNFRRASGTELDFVSKVQDLHLRSEHEPQVFHLVQEALHNITRHAHAQHAWLHILPTDGGGVDFVVEDDGVGLGRGHGGPAHHGLEIMAERARRLGGVLEVGPRSGGGTRVKLAVPAATAAASTRSAEGH